MCHSPLENPQQNIFKFQMVLEEETQQKLEISSEKTTRKGKFPFHASEIIGNCPFPLSFHRENSHEILIFFAVTHRSGDRMLWTKGNVCFCINRSKILRPMVRQ